MSKKALVLSSGGVDSTTCVSVAVHELGFHLLWAETSQGT